MGVETSHGNPTLVVHEPLFGTCCDAGVRASCRGLGYRIVQKRCEGIEAASAQPACVIRVDEVVQKVSQLHDMAVSIEDHAISCVGHGGPFPRGFDLVT